jgi:hypothetical protein
MKNKVKIIGGRRAGKTISALQEFYEHGKKGNHDLRGKVDSLLKLKTV